MTEFTMSGLLNDSRQSLTWREGVGFDEGIAGQVARDLVSRGTEVWLTETGPFRTASDQDAEVALVTALNVFNDARASVVIEGDHAEELKRWLDSVTSIPEGATP